VLNDFAGPPVSVSRRVAARYRGLRVTWVTPLRLLTASIRKPSSRASSPSQSRSSRPNTMGTRDDVRIVDQAGGQELADDARAAVDADIRASGGLARLRKRLGGAGVEEVKRGAAVHLDWEPEMVGENKDRGVERRVVSPPPVPLLVRPGAVVGPN
jgi:hypothetical protein